MQVSKGIVLITVGLIALLAIVLAFVLGRQSASTTSEQAVAAKPAVQPLAIRAAPQEKILHPDSASQKLPKTEPPATDSIKLAHLTDSDVAKLDPGAGCTFSKEKQLLIVTNFDQALIKTGKSATVHNLDDTAGRRLWEGAQRARVGKYDVVIKRTGAEKTEGEVWFSSATISVSDGLATTSIKGEWSCGS